MKIILASKSPRRRELMKMSGLDFEILASNSDEKVDENLSLEEQSIEIAYQKAKEVFDHTQGDRCIIGADTLVILNNQQLGKPASRKEAKEMLEKIQGGKHEVFTSIAVLIEKNGKVTEVKDLDITEVYVNKMSEREIEDYLEEDMPFDIAGSYKIQSRFRIFVEKIDGNYDTIVGLPTSKIYKILKENDVI